MTDGDERREPATDERYRRDHDKSVVAIVLDEDVLVAGPVTDGGERRELATDERYRCAVVLIL